MVTLVPFTRAEHEAYVAAQTLDYAEWLVERGDAPNLNVALDRARAEIEPEVAAALADGDELWAVRDAGGATVGWLWLKPGYAPQAAFLYQILVVPEHRRRGHARAMLDALEEVLASTGRHELRLNVWDTNVPGRGLYAAAGYALVEQLEGKQQLGKRF